MSNFESLDETPLDLEEERNNTALGHGFQEIKGRFKGDIDPVTKLRNGTGTYTYTNNYF